MEPRFSLCIPTMDRFDSFLYDRLISYCKLLETCVIDEIVISDENGNDYQKIIEEFGGKYSEKLRVYKNDNILGVFLNKIKVTSYAKDGNFVALIDSDNTVDESYFNYAKEYIIKNNITPDIPVVLAPTFSKPMFDHSTYNGIIVDSTVLVECIEDFYFEIFLNTANYIITKSVDEKIKYNPDLISNIDVIDTLYKHLLAFKYIPEYRIHAVTGMHYEHAVHDGSYYIQHHNTSIEEFRERFKHELATYGEVMYV